MVTLSCLMEKTFAEWLVEQLNLKGISQQELARRTGISSAHVSRIVSGERGVGEKSLYLISKALQIPPEELYRRYGLLPPKPKESAEDEELLYLFHQLPPSEREEAKEYLKFKLEHKRAASKKKTALSV